MSWKIPHLIVVIFGFFCAVVIGQSTDCTTPNGEKAKCIPLSSCTILKNAFISGDATAAKFVEASACPNGPLTVCCGTSATFISRPVTPPTLPTVVSKEERKKLRRNFLYEKSLLPSKKFCGMQHWDDYFHTDAAAIDGTEASVDEFPWLMIVDSSRRCAGYLISKRFFISTVLCYFYRNAEESKIQIGVHHIRKPTSCVATDFEVDDCTETFEVQSEKVFDLGRRIVLAKLTQDIDFSDFIRPICLPFEPDENPKVNATVMTSGWGEAGNSELYVKIKKRSRQTIVGNDKCYSKFIPKWESDICTLALRNSTVTTCWGDEGGPVMYHYDNNWFAAATINTASDCTVGDPTSATRITPDMVNRVVDYIFLDYCEETKNKSRICTL